MITEPRKTVRIQVDPIEDKITSKLAEYFRSELKKRQEV